MYLSVKHTTSYSYGDAVMLDPHIIRLSPRADSHRRLMERTLTIMPEPDGISANLEHDGSVSHMVWFQRQTTSLKIVSKIVLEVNEINPFDFIIQPARCVVVPMTYPSPMLGLLKPYLEQARPDARVKAFTDDVLKESQFNLVEFTALLCRKIHEQCAYEVRDTGEPLSPQKLLACRRGSCRDLTVLYIAAARNAGLAARFVSGYYFDQSPKHPQLHAWAEVYIPGAGWRGFDPTLGLACYGHHIALSAAPSAAQTAVIEGSFLGKPQSCMETQIEYEYLGNAFYATMRP